MEAIAWDLVESWPPGYCFILGPGTTTRAIAERLGCEKTLVGVDVVSREKVLIRDASEGQLLDLLKTSLAKIVVTPVGGQGFLFGRGNQPISPRVIELAGVENLVVVCTPGKLHSFAGRPLLVDSGDADLDNRLAGHIRLITGYRERAVYRIGG
jgi:predicted polyphosphate/ATP-dependent NAD kinase